MVLSLACRISLLDDDLSEVASTAGVAVRQSLFEDSLVSAHASCAVALVPPTAPPEAADAIAA
jgi:hypothetical protein